MCRSAWSRGCAHALKVLDCSSQQQADQIPLQAGGYGHLKDGLLIEVNLQTGRQLLAQPPCALLAALGKKVAFELVVGQNGRVWVKADTARNTIIVAQALPSAHVNAVQADQLIRQLSQRQQQAQV